MNLTDQFVKIDFPSVTYPRRRGCFKNREQSDELLRKLRINLRGSGFSIRRMSPGKNRQDSRKGESPTGETFAACDEERSEGISSENLSDQALSTRSPSAAKFCEKAGPQRSSMLVPKEGR